MVNFECDHPLGAKPRGRLPGPPAFWPPGPGPSGHLFPRPSGPLAKNFLLVNDFPLKGLHIGASFFKPEHNYIPSIANLVCRNVALKIKRLLADVFSSLTPKETISTSKKPPRKTHLLKKEQPPHARGAGGPARPSNPSTPRPHPASHHIVNLTQKS